jgi:PhnB protein
MADMSVRLGKESVRVDEETTDPQVVPYLLYVDAGAAMEWLVNAFGFTVRARDTRRDGTVRHGELQLDQGGVIMLGSAEPGYLGPARLGGVTQLVRIRVTDLESHRDQTKAISSEVSEVQSGPPGWRSYSVSDPEGHQWYFTEPSDRDT